MQILKINILQGSVVTPFRCGDVCNNLLCRFPAECNSEKNFKNGPTLLKYPPEYTAYFFEPSCMSSRVTSTFNQSYAPVWIPKFS